MPSNNDPNKGKKQQDADNAGEDQGMEASPGVRTPRSPTASRTEQQYREIQREVDQQHQQHQQKQQKQQPSQGGGGQQQKQQGGSQQGQAAQTATREEPTPPFPKQHLEKPGLESDVNPRPRFQAPGYKGSDKLKDMVAIITGGDSGIGRAVAVLFAREGADVAIIYLPVEQSDADETRRVIEQEGRKCLCLPGDVSDFNFCQQAVSATVQEFGKLDILVNNAAFQEHAKSLDELTVEHFDRTVKTNLYGYFFMAKAAVQHMKEGSAIINTGSITGLEGEKTLLDYSTTKGGIHAFTRSLSENLVEKGIRVNAVAPGPVWTPLNPADGPPDKVVKFGSDTPMKRPAQPEELSPLYVFLAAPSCSSYITGTIMPVTGGEVVS